MKHRIKTILTITLLTALFAEMFLWLVKPKGLEFYRLQKTIHVFDESYFVDLEPDINTTITHFLGYFSMKFSTNESGFRATRKINHLSPQIGCIGDSVTMGFGVDDKDTFCARLDHFRPGWQSVNMGVDAYGPAAIANKLEKYAPQLNLKLLYYLPSGGDDIDDELYYKRKNNYADYLLFKTQFILTKYSYLFLGLKIAQEQIKYRTLETFVLPVARMQKTIACRKGQIPADECSDAYSYSFADFISDFTVPGRTATGSVPVFPASECVARPDKFTIPERMISDLERIAAISKKHKIKLVYVLAPTDIETAWCTQRDQSHRFFAYLSSLKEILHKQNIPYIDLTHYTKRMADEQGRLNPRPYYIVGDGHFTRKGNEWIARILLEQTPGYLK